MESSLYYFKWFQKIISVFIDIFFFVAPLASLYVLTNAFQGAIRIVLYIVLISAYLAVIYFFRDKIKTVLFSVQNYLDRFDTKKMCIIILVFALIVKVLFTILFNYDATVEGDVQIYNDIADHIIETGDIHSDAISHLYGVALHFVVFKLLGLPLHVGIFIVFMIGTMINFFSFKELIGKNKAFMAVMFYLVMPSTILLTFCPTHELFIYLYISLFLFVYNRLIKSEEIKKIVLYSVLVVLSLVLACFVNPGGYIAYIIILLTALLSNVKWSKKAIIIACLLVSILCSNALSSYLNVNEYSTTINTYTILIHGTNAESLGEQVDGYPLKQMRKFIYENTLDFSQEGFVYAAKNVFMNQCLYLLKHPVTLVRLIAHKIYILWSGVHYPIELAQHYNALGSIVYYLFLAISTIIYLFVFTLGNVYYHKKENDDICVSNYKLEVLGVIALTMMCILANKYGIYITLFIYFTAFYRTEFKKE